MDLILITIAILSLAAVAAPIVYFGIGKHKGVGRQATGKWVCDPWTKNVDLTTDGNLFHFKFPNKDGVHTIEKTVNGLKVNDMVKAVFEITGNSPRFTSQNPQLPAQVRLYIGRGRLYSLGNYHCDLKLGRQTLMVPLTPEAWKTVDGFPCNYDAGHIVEFKDAVTEAELLGLCFGDEGGANAHGANLLSLPQGGSAEFRLLSFSP